MDRKDALARVMELANEHYQRTFRPPLAMYVSNDVADMIFPGGEAPTRDRKIGAICINGHSVTVFRTHAPEGTISIENPAEVVTVQVSIKNMSEEYIAGCFAHADRVREAALRFLHAGCSDHARPLKWCDACSEWRDARQALAVTLGEA